MAPAPAGSEIVTVPDGPSWGRVAEHPAPAMTKATNRAKSLNHFMSSAAGESPRQSTKTATRQQAGSSGKHAHSQNLPQPQAPLRRAHARSRWLLAGLATALMAPGANSQPLPKPPPAPAQTQNWNLRLSSGFKETFDSNVLLQDQTAQANHASFVSSWIGSAQGSWSSAPWKVRLSYQPEVHFYHAEPSENFASHRATAETAFRNDTTTVDATGNAMLIDGDSQGPTWTGPGGAPATGGVAVRDRRDAAIYRGSLRVLQSFGPWWVRPTLTGYDHDFRTAQKLSPGYQNYVDRKEFTVGTDAGRCLEKDVFAGFGYRYGEQDESQLLGCSEEYDSQYHRLLAVIEGSLTPWLKMTVSAGPEWRTYGDRVPSSFGSHDVSNLYADVCLTATASKSDTLTASVKQFEQPGFGGRSAYEDLTIDLGWRHKFRQHWTLGTGGRAYTTDFLAPVVRNDWVLSWNTFANVAVTQACHIEGSYAFEEGWTRDPNASGREYTRHLVALGLTYTFR